MKQFTDGSNNFPLVEKSTSSAGSSPTADNFNGVTEEIVNPVLEVGFPLDPLSGALIGSDGKPMLESESNKQLLRSIQHLDQDTYLKGVDDRNLLIKNLIGEGIVQGLVATKTDTLIVSISKGLGYDSLGHQILLSDPIIVDLNSEASATEKTISLALRYSIVKADYKIGDENPNYKDTIVITAVHGADVQSDDFVISAITINSTGITNIIAEGFKFNNTFVENTNLINSLSSILSKGADGSANLTGTSFNITATDDIKDWKIGNDQASVESVNYQGYAGLGLIARTSEKPLWLHGRGLGFLFNYPERTPFILEAVGGLTLHTTTDSDGKVSNVNFDTRGQVNINGSPIIETGSVPGRGSYTKFYDGTMICSIIRKSTSYAHINWEFPVVFYDFPTLIGYTVYWMNFSGDEKQRSDHELTYINKSNLSVTTPIPPNYTKSDAQHSVVVIGRWKVLPT